MPLSVDRRLLALPPVAAAALALALPTPTGARTSFTVNASGDVVYHHREPKTKTIEQRGTLRGRPFTSGTVVLRSKLAKRLTLEFSVRLTTPRGTVWGTGTARLKSSGSQASYSGTLRIFRGDGRYRKISKSVLTVTGNGDARARRTTLRITGRVSY